MYYILIKLQESRHYHNSGADMTNGYIVLKKSPALNGTVGIVGAKNAVLVTIASLILVDGISILENVPCSADVIQMIALLEDLGARITFDKENKRLEVDASGINTYEVKPEIMSKMRASILVMGPLLARFGKVKVARPGGCLLGARLIDYHLMGFRKMGALIEEEGPYINATLSKPHNSVGHVRIIFDYPSVGATENILMFATLYDGETTIINAALEPEVFNLIDALTKMGARIEYLKGACLRIKGVGKLQPIKHAIIPDRLEVGAILLAAAITGGTVSIPDARADHMDLFLEKLREMGHSVITGTHATQECPSRGIKLLATPYPKAVTIKTGPYPGFPTDLQAPMMAALCLADGTSVIEETVYENRLIHVNELKKMGAQITVEGNKAMIRGVDALYGNGVIATDIRASCSLVLAGLVAEGDDTKISGVHHWRRGYDELEHKLNSLGAHIEIFD